jgi:hypothetical protein
MSDERMREQQYLGDGVYAAFDGFSIWLTTPRADGVHRIALEPSVFKALVDYARRIQERRST